MIVFRSIDMEGLRSRSASVYPAYDRDGNVIYFDEASVSGRNGEYPSNYSLLPLDLVFTSKDDFTLNPKGVYRLSFPRVQDIFSFFRNYRHLLSGGSSCGLSYSSSTEFYKREASAGDSGDTTPRHRFDDDLPYGSNKENYDELKKRYDGLGGDKFYKWLSENVFPSFEIPLEYRDAWNTERLYYPDVMKWMGWFSERSSYSEYEFCSASTDCCDCEKYWSLGGSYVLSQMKTWYTTVNERIDVINETISGSTSAFTPHIEQQIKMCSTVFDLGNESILYEEYNPRDWYYDGNVINVSGESMILSGDSESTSGGHVFNETYLEKSPNDKWKPYDEGYKSIYPESALTDGYIVSGKTASRLLDLRSTELLTDDIGNTLEGTYDVSGAKNHQPQENETLGLMYKVGNVANVDRFGGGYMIGDIITDMTFYNVNISGGVVPVSDFPTGYSGESVYCDVEYLVGATLEAVDGKISVKQGYDSGITYNETVMFVKTKRDYYLKRKNVEAVPTKSGSPIEHSVSYPVYVWELRQNIETARGSNYKDYDAPVSDFSVRIKPSGSTDDMNYTDSYPTFREEYNIGINSFQNVDADIYIDRGINSAFELHLKLGEVSSLDSLLKYGNNYFAIMED